MDFTPIPKQFTTPITCTVRRASFTMRDGWVHGGFWIDLTGSGTAGTEFKITAEPTTDGVSFLPAPLSANAGLTVGRYEYICTATAVRYTGNLTWDGTDLRFKMGGVVAVADYLGQSGPSFTSLSGDSASGQFFYEAE